MAGIASIAASIVAAACSYNIVEQPFSGSGVASPEFKGIWKALATTGSRLRHWRSVTTELGAAEVDMAPCV